MYMINRNCINECVCVYVRVCACMSSRESTCVHAGDCAYVPAYARESLCV